MAKINMLQHRKSIVNDDLWMQEQEGASPKTFCTKPLPQISATLFPGISANVQYPRPNLYYVSSGKEIDLPGTCLNNLLLVFLTH